jgi:hypothetical protein
MDERSSFENGICFPKQTDRIISIEKRHSIASLCFQKESDKVISVTKRQRISKTYVKLEKENILKPIYSFAIDIANIGVHINAVLVELNLVQFIVISIESAKPDSYLVLPKSYAEALGFEISAFNANQTYKSNHFQSEKLFNQIKAGSILQFEFYFSEKTVYVVKEPSELKLLVFEINRAIVSTGCGVCLLNSTTLEFKTNDQNIYLQLSPQILRLLGMSELTVMYKNGSRYSAMVAAVDQ